MPLIIKDEIFDQSLQRHRMVVGFLQTLKENFDFETAFKLASEGFKNYMINYYSNVIGENEVDNQKRFNKFRKHYEKCSEISPYLKIIESNPSILKVKYERCPFMEVLDYFQLTEYSYAFCLSDPAFTKELLPGVTFIRNKVIAKGDKFCDHTWKFDNKDKEI